MSDELTLINRLNALKIDLHELLLKPGLSPKQRAHAVDHPEELAWLAAQHLDERIVAEQAATARLVEAHDALRLQHARLQAKTHQAGRQLAHAAKKHRLPELAHTAQGFGGQPREDALHALPTATAILKAAREAAERDG